LPWAGQPLNNLLHSGGLKTKLSKYTSGNPAFFTDQAQQKVLSPDVVMPHAFSFLMSQAEHTPRSLCKSFHTRHGTTSY
jgi:hypothetical protein